MVIPLGETSPSEWPLEKEAFISPVHEADDGGVGQEINHVQGPAILVNAKDVESVNIYFPKSGKVSFLERRYFKNLRRDYFYDGP